jgi:transcription-repair coupling factor (superfamily II helicase)
MSPPTLTAIAEAVAAGPVIVHGATAAWAAAAIAAVRRATPPGTPVVAVVADETAARRLETDLEPFLGDPRQVVRLPGLDVSPYAELSPDHGIVVARLAALARLALGGAHAPAVLVTTADALLRRTLDREALLARTFAVRTGDTIDRDATAARLVAAGFARVPIVEDPGSLAVRGGVLDVFAPLMPYPVRLELLGDEVESIRLFDPATQRTLREVPEVLLHPVRETIITAAGGLAAVKARLRDVADRVAHPSKATRRLLDQLEGERADFVGIETLTPAFHDRMAPPWALVGPEAPWVVVDPDAVVGAARAEREDAARRHDERERAQLLSLPVDDHYADLAELEATLLAPRRRLHLPSLELAGDPRAAGAVVLRAEVDGLRGLAADLERARSADAPGHPLVRFVTGALADGHRVVIVCDAASRAERIAGLLAHHDLPVHPPAPDGAPGLLDAPAGRVTLVPGGLSAGFASPADHLAVLSTAQIFGARRAASRSRGAARRARDALLGGVSDFGQLAIGDHLVHQLHGVGRYQGLVKLPIGVIQLDFLHLEYDGGTLYLPVYRLGEVQRYVGAEGHPPRLDRLGGLTWEKARSKASRHVRALAEELLQLYAQRAALPGHRFPPADEMFRDLEASFPFEETPDQQAAIDAVLADMESPRAMDRLVCGDVGYGKTEVALRAIFRCVLGGKQAALLAPTTVLVEQHARTLAERLAPFPVRLGVLSRFQSRGEQAATIKGLAAGAVDVVIGTHRLLSADVRFADLGLVVIDEEQRFGVAHKERLKKLRASVDVLTLTATPIPRTLHLAMAGLRDLSIIATPPADRRAVRTLVSRLDEPELAAAIRRELARGGQVFWIVRHIGEDRRRGRPDPDDRSLQEWAALVRALVPEARVAVAHGQLPSEALEEVMVEFVAGRHDVLVSTTIVESGLDIPRANTMFVARADTFGLAQLYQLRGRIGRARERAYCYLLVPSPDRLTDEARRRLEVLQRFTDLGAGFHIASHDLEIRGGGEVLGPRQSGSIAAVGFDQYVRMLESAVAELRGEPVHHPIDPELTVEVPGFLPDDYVPDTGQRLDLYKRLSSAEDEEEVRALLAEIADRYGPPPADLLLLCDLMVIKALARRLHAVAVELTAARLALALPASTPLDPGRLSAPWRVTPDGRLVRALTADEARAPAQAARRHLLELAARVT